MGYCSLDVGIIMSSNGTARMDHDREQLIDIGTLEIGGGKREEEEEGGGGGGGIQCMYTYRQMHT